MSEEAKFLCYFGVMITVFFTVLLWDRIKQIRIPSIQFKLIDLFVFVTWFNLLLGTIVIARAMKSLDNTFCCGVLMFYFLAFLFGGETGLIGWILEPTIEKLQKRSELAEKYCYFLWLGFMLVASPLTFPILVVYFKHH